MSISVTAATWRILNKLPETLKALPANHRPSWQNCALVALFLADQMRDSKGYADETIGQIVAALPISEGCARDCLAALDHAGWWVRETAGNRHRGARRVPQVADLHRGADPATQDDLERGSDPAACDESDESRARDDGTYSAGWDPLERGVSPAPPHSSPCSSPKESTHGFNSGEGNLLDEDISELRVLRITRLVTDTPDQLIAAEVRHVLTEHTSWPNQDIADRVAAMPHVVAR